LSGSLVCVIPALDAASSLPAVVRGIRASLPNATIVCIDDGSADATHDVAAALCDEVVRHAVNRGKGAALRTGFAAALARGAEIVLTIDADGQHDAAHAPALLAALDAADIVIGARVRKESDMPLHRRMTNALSSAAVTRLAGCDVPDAQSGYRAIRSTVLRAVNGQGDRYEYETDFIIRAGRAGFRIASVPIPTVYGAPSHFRHVGDGALIISTIWRHRNGVAG
jgi:glycosyltransferase involved in cell wall biosynthesis